MIAVRSSEIVADFVKVAALAGISIPASDIEFVELPAPHRPPSSLPAGKLAVYVFMHGARCLKVGKAGPKSAARYCSQHYGAMRAPSTLARSLVQAQFGGSTPLDEANIAAWIRANTDRVNFLIPSSYGVAVLSLLEAFIQCRLKPEFEGFASQRAVTHKGAPAGVLASRARR